MARQVSISSSRPKNRSASVDVVGLQSLPRAGGHRHGRLVVSQRGVLTQDRLLEGGDLRRRVDAQLTSEDRAELPDGAQRLALGTRAVLGQGEELPTALPHRGGTDHLVGAGEGLAGVAATELRVQQELLGIPAELLETIGLPLGGRPLGEVREGPPAPQLERLLQQERGSVRLTQREELAGSCHLCLEPLGVHVVGTGPSR